MTRVAGGGAPAKDTRKWSDLQEAIFAWFESGEGNLVVTARAGSGKTSTSVEGINRAPESNIWFAAYNKHIQVEMERRLENPAAVAKTIHAIGYACIKRKWGDEAQGVDNDRSYRLADEALADPKVMAEVRAAPPPESDKLIPEFRNAPYVSREAGGAVASVMTKIREIIPFAFKEERAVAVGQVEDVMAQFDLLPEEKLESQGWSAVRIAIAALHAVRAAAEFKDRRFDFADMLFLPLVNGWCYPRFDLIVVDECLPYHTPVMLADGTSRKIGDIVKSREAVEVMSYDTTTGQQVKSRVTAWQEIPNRKPLVKVSARRRIKGRSVPIRDHVTCTIDHKIWTKNRGWVTAGSVVAGDVIQVESAAVKSHWYKITSKGRKKLGDMRATKDRPTPGRQGRIIHRGGNGCPAPRSEVALRETLGTGWGPCVVSTGAYRGRDGLPNHYKIDIANEQCKIAVEVDGASHSAPERKEQDARKTKWLEAHGWRVFRFSKREAWQNPRGCAEKVLGAPACPVDATVVAVDPVDIRDDFVYDLTVENTHCFYANGVLVHNCQDMSNPMMSFVRKMLKAHGRIAMVGDDMQAIYGFRGADSSAMGRIGEQLGAASLPLNITYRCPQAVVRVAQRLVPDFYAAPAAPEGAVREIRVMDLASQVQVGDFVVSRVNAPLLRVALDVMLQKKPVRIVGRQIGDALVKLVGKVHRGVAPISDFLESLWDYREEAVERLQASRERSARSKLEKLLDQVEALEFLSSGLRDAGGSPDTGTLVQKIRMFFSEQDPQRCVTLSTVHGVKGLEADRVFILRDTLYVYGMRKGESEERNIEYVAVTRAKKELVWVVGRPGEQDEPPMFQVEE